MDDREIVITRLIDAPRERVFDVWTDPQHVGHWWGPNGFTITTHEMRAEVGGVWQFMMHGPDGKDWPNRIVFSEVVRPERLAYSHGDFEREHFTVVVSFIAVGDKTRLTLHSTFPSAEACAAVKAHGAVEGGKQTLDRCAAYVAQQMAQQGR
ncbi:MAG: SRPBCC family protein [Rhodocyclaceae bacterium]